MMEKLAQPGEGGGCTTPAIFHDIYNMYEVVVYAPAQRADTLPLALFLLYPYVLCGQQHRIWNLLNNTANLLYFEQSFFTDYVNQTKKLTGHGT